MSETVIKVEGLSKCYLVGHRSRLRVLLTWFWSFLTYARGARLIPSTADEEERSYTEAVRPAGSPETVPQHEAPQPPQHH